MTDLRLWKPPPPRAHILLMGEPKVGKTTIIADAPKPLRVLQFDPLGAEAAYHLRGIVLDYEQSEVGYRIQRVVSRREPHPTIIQIDYFSDSDARMVFAERELTVFGDCSQTHAYEDFRAMRQQLLDEVEAGRWATVALDSTSYLELAALNLSNKLSPKKEGKAAYADAKNLMQQDLMMALAHLPCNVIIACHIDTERDEERGRVVRNPKLPGKLRSFSAGGYTEFYHVYVDRETGERRIQTQPGGDFNCSTSYVIDAPDGLVVPDRGVGIWKMLMSNYTARIEREQAAIAAMQKGESA